MKAARRAAPRSWRGDHGLHPAWVAFVQYCESVQHGEISQLKIQDGIPVLAEITMKKVKFT